MRAGATKAVVVDHSTVEFRYNWSRSSNFGFDYGGYQFQPRLITYHHLNTVLQQEQDQNSDVCRRARGLQDQIWVKEDFEHNEDPNRPVPEFDKPASDFINAIFARDRVPRVKTGDELVLHFALAAMDAKAFQPRLMLVNFAGPDVAHQGSYSDYVGQIMALDGLVDKLWTSLRKNRAYAKNTLLLVTPDCGRSLSGEGKGGFIDHWAGDDGCRHTWALFLGQGIPGNKRFQRPYTQLDLAPTIGEILDIPTPGCEGTVMEETK
ncbi:MAG: alkaline phosphatase family protein, partial [Planctomycetota bacterium]|jgi:arylsulfatase A-like enzyme